MSGFIVFIIIAIAWVFFGALKAGADKVGNPSRNPNPIPMRTEQRTVASPNIKPMEKIDSTRRGAFSINQSKMKMEDRLSNFGDTVEVVKPPNIPVKKAEKVKALPKEGKKELATLFKGDRLVESIILSECLDRPRAYRPHPLTQQQNMLKRRG